MTPLQELRASAVGEAFVKLLYRKVAVVATLHQFPPPEGHAAWSADAVAESAHDFLAAGETYRKLLELSARVDNDEGLERLLATMVRNHLRQRGRRTTLGKLIRRLRTVLEAAEDFTVVADSQPGAGNIALSGGPTEPYAGSPDALRDAARGVERVTVVRWSPKARREGPVADAGSLRALCRAVLAAAEASLPIADLAEAIAVRLGIDPRAVPGALAVEDLDGWSGDEDAAPVASAEPSLRADGEQFERAEITEAVLAQLSEREKLVLAWLHETVRVISDRTGLAVSTAGTVKQRVSDKVSTMLLDLDEQSAVRIATAARDAARKELGLDPL